ncbi:MAG: outer membrane protein transport protein [Gammaproteobacteria bacterium]|nr:outer membrane protein transport protein [Gammaproteobacteria bacterium]
MKSRIGAVIFVCGCPGLVHASGNVLPRANSESLGMADANVALASGPAAQIINPANIVDIPRGVTQWESGTLLGRADASFSRTTATSAGRAGDVNARTTYPLVPFFAIANRWSERVTIGFSVDSPHGLSSEWKDHTWDVDLGSLGSGDMVKLSQLTVLRFGPTAAWRVDERWSVGARLFAQYVEAIDENDIATLRASGTSAGLQLGVRYRTPEFIFGAAYTTPTNTKLNGEQTNIHAAATSLVPGTVNTRMLLPARLQAGLAFRLYPALWWEVDLDWIGWSYNDSLTIYQANGTVISPNKAVRHYNDTLSFRTGLKWEKSARLTLHAGYGYDPTPVPERDASPSTSFLRKSRLAFGGRYQLERGAHLDFAYQFIYGHPRKINASDQDLFGSTDTHLFEGTYESRSHVLGLSFTARF